MLLGRCSKGGRDCCAKGEAMPLFHKSDKRSGFTGKLPLMSLDDDDSLKGEKEPSLQDGDQGQSQHPLF